MTIGPTVTATPLGPGTSPFTVSSTLITTGSGFDTCAAPSVSAMAAWAPTALNAVGVYVGGINRSCPDGNLSAAWVTKVRSYGYTFIPTYVGRQAPCIDRTDLVKIDPAQAETQGVSAANDAVGQMAKFGLGKGNPVYLDIEYYVSDATCGPAVLKFVSGWTKQLHALGYASGLYSTATSTANDMAHLTSNTYVLPDALWFARWNGLANLDAMPYVPDWMWLDHRLKQYSGGHPETHGGVTINIDSNYLHGPIALPGSY
ncbi:MAG TPA: glycoside hydrolase domain-containing protein [Mycobacteriales bacterium]